MSAKSAIYLHLRPMAAFGAFDNHGASTDNHANEFGLTAFALERDFIECELDYLGHRLFLYTTIRYTGVRPAMPSMRFTGFVPTNSTRPASINLRSFIRHHCGPCPTASAISATVNPSGVALHICSSASSKSVKVPVFETEPAVFFDSM
jgi:hypothetical protein